MRLQCSNRRLGIKYQKVPATRHQPLWNPLFNTILGRAARCQKTDAAKLTTEYCAHLAGRIPDAFYPLKEASSSN